MAKKMRVTIEIDIEKTLLVPTTKYDVDHLLSLKGLGMIDYLRIISIGGYGLLRKGYCRPIKVELLENDVTYISAEA